MRLVSLERVKEYARISSGTAEDDTVDLLLQAASGAVSNHLRDSASITFLDSDGNPVETDSDDVAVDVPEVVQAATLWLTAWLYKNRDEDPDKAFDGGWLPFPVRTLLGPLRDPVFS